MMDASSFDASVPITRSIDPDWARDAQARNDARLNQRNEREVRRIVRALARFDDQTLRKIGILDRSQIEFAVRFCREC
jgi:uncharacterized protein YjiS (DUF1127 family)